jgi:acyl-CoA synthetase (AMP-forming)/AMP-acid ligase II
MTAVIMEGGAAAWRTPQAPDVPDLTLPEFVLGPAYQHGGKRALVDAATGHELSYAELADAVREVGAGLSARGIRPGDVLALCTPNCLEFAVTSFAATSAGAIVTTVNPLCTEEEISRQLRQTGARWLVATAGLIEQKLNAAVGGTTIAETFVIGEGLAGQPPSVHFAQPRTRQPRLSPRQTSRCCRPPAVRPGCPRAWS